MFKGLHICTIQVCDDALIFWWFGDALLSMSLQKSTIFANQTLTFYNVSIIGLAKRVTHNNTKTQKPTATTNRSRHPPTPQRLCPLPP